MRKVSRWLLVLGAYVVLTAHANASLVRVYNELQIDKDAPYGLGAISMILSGGHQDILLPGHYLSFKREIAVQQAIVRVAKKDKGDFEEVSLPKQCMGRIKPGQGLYVKGQLVDGKLKHVSCPRRRHQSK